MRSSLLRKRLVPHVRQSHNWDCGFACAEMVLRALGVPPAECSLSRLQQLVPSSSIWYAKLRIDATCHATCATRASACQPSGRASRPSSLLVPVPRTVDLAYVFHSFGARFRYTTKTIGVDPSYHAEPFYRATFDADTARVNDLFAKAEGPRAAAGPAAAHPTRRSVRPPRQLLCSTRTRRNRRHPPTVDDSIGVGSAIDCY